LLRFARFLGIEPTAIRGGSTVEIECAIVAGPSYALSDDEAKALAADCDGYFA
jgi:hypothetical protein